MLFFCTGLKINIKFDETELLLFMNDYSTYLNADFVGRSKNTRTVGWTFNKGRTDRLVSDIRAIYTRKNKTWTECTIYMSMSYLIRRVLAKPCLILDKMCRLYGKFASYFSSYKWPCYVLLRAMNLKKLHIRCIML